MQAQKARSSNRVITHSQSLAAVQTLLHAGLGSIAYLRNLLPDDNFSACHFTASDDGETLELLSSQDASRTNGTGIMEYGIFDALEKCYLRSFVFAIYLDSKDPNNIIEAYTFNFQYHTVPGSNTPLPVMTFGHSTGSSDPVSRAVKSGKAPSLKELRTSVKNLVKTLINAMNSMEPLPRRRYATFKVYYTEETPMDYEPPNFQTGDLDRDKWYFMTHDFDEIPDRYKIGKLATGHHTVKLTVTSIATYIPPRSARKKGEPSMTPQQEVNLAMREGEQQIQDAETRNLVYSADDDIDLDPDADGEEDATYTQQANVVEEPLPIGLRSEKGDIIPIPEETLEARFDGFSEQIATKLQDMAPGNARVVSNIEETQNLFETPRKTTLPTSSIPESESSINSSTSTPTWPRGLNLNLLKNMSISGAEKEDSEMLDLETQRPVEAIVDPIESFETTPRVQHDAVERTSSTKVAAFDKGVECNCGVEIDDECCFCEGSCGKWFHLWCMGFHSANDPRIPKSFVCFDCLAKASPDWDFIKMSIYPRTFEKFCEITTIRRAIKIAENLRSFAATDFNRAYGCTAATGTRLIKLLEDQDFVQKESAQSPDHRAAKGKGKAKGRPKKNLQKFRYMFNFSMQTKPQYMDYFKPNEKGVQDRLLGISALAKKQGVPSPVIEETQTQPETMVVNEKGPKRGLAENVEPDERPTKRVKISIAAAVDLAE